MTCPVGRNFYKNINPKGSLSILDSQDVPFPIKRVFWIDDVPPLGMRGGHAHKTCQQMFTVISGEIEYTITHREEFPTYRVGAADSKAFYIPPMYWLDIKFLRPGTIVLVLCSEDYDEADYIRSKDEYTKAINQV